MKLRVVLKKHNPSNLIRLIPTKGFESFGHTIIYLKDLCPTNTLERKVFKKLLLLLLISIANPLMANLPQLTIYTYSSFASEWGPGPIIKQKFEQQYHCKVKLVSLSDSVAMFNRLRLEGKKSSADIVLGLDNNLLAEAQETGLFQPHQLDNSKLTIANGWHNDYFYPYDFSYFAFIYNQNKLKTPPHSMQELIESPQPWRIVYQDPRTSSVGQGLLLWIEYLYGDKSQQAWQQLSKKTLTVTKGWSEAYNLMLNGEADLVLSYTSSPVYHIENEKKYQYHAASFTEGHYMQIETVGITRSTKQFNLAQSFIKFLTRPDIQTIIALKNSMYPVVATDLPASYHQLITVDKPLSFPAQEVAKNRDRWIKTWQTAVSQ